MVELSTKYNKGFILVKDVYNKPGSAATIMQQLKNHRIPLDNFQVVTTPNNPIADSFMVVVPISSAGTALKVIGAANGDVMKSHPILMENLVGVEIRGLTGSDATEILSRAFSVCGKLNINITVSFTTYVSLQIYIKAMDFKEELIDELGKEFGILNPERKNN